MFFLYFVNAFVNYKLTYLWNGYPDFFNMYGIDDLPWDEDGKVYQQENSNNTE